MRPVFTAAEMRALDARVRLDILVVLLAVAGSVGVAFVLSNWLQRGIARPVRALAETARSISDHKDYSIRASVVTDLTPEEIDVEIDAAIEEVRAEQRALTAAN